MTIKLLLVLSLIWAFWDLLILWSRHDGESSSGGPKLDWAEGLFCSLAGLAIMVGVCGVLLSWIGLYTITVLSGILFSFSLICTLCFRSLTKVPRFLRGGIFEIGLALILASCLLVYFRPHEYILGSADAGTYMNIAANLAKTGRWVVQDEFSAWLSQYGPTAFYHSPTSLPVQWQFYGWYNDPLIKDRILPQFFPMHPCLLAVGVWLGGVWGGLYVTPLWGMMAIAAVYLLSRRLFNRPVALLAAILLAISPTQFYFSRYPTAEPLTLVFLFVGLLSFQHIWDQNPSRLHWAIMGGSAIGCALLTRIDLPLVVIIVLVTFELLRCGNRWNKNWTVFGGIFGIFLLVTLLFVYLQGWIYFTNTYGIIWKNYRKVVVAAVALILLAIIVPLVRILFLRGFSCGISQKSVVNHRFFRWSLGSLVVALSGYAYFIHPLIVPPDFGSGAEIEFIPRLDSLNWIRMGWYLTPLGLILATGGLFYIVTKENLHRLVFFLSIGVLTTFQYIAKSMITPYHIYCMRRYFPLVIPVLLIFAAVALHRISTMGKRPISKAIGISLGVLLCLGLAHQSRHLVLLRDLKGVVNDLTELAHRFPPRSILLINDRDFADRFGVPLKYIFGFDIATVRQDNEMTLPFLEDLIQRARSRQQPIHLLAVNPLSETVKRHLIFAPDFEFPVKVRALKNTYTEYPRFIEEAYYGLETYRVSGVSRRADVSKATPGSLTIDVGGFDAGNVRSGFFGKEFIPRSPSMRWTTDKAVLDFPGTSPRNLILKVRAMIFLPPSRPLPRVEIWLDDRNIGQFHPNRDWQVFQFQGRSLPSGGRSTLTFISETFTPKALGINQDSRQLGFLLDWVTIDFSR
jgi:4-amino-4-deoxy-L-arabinose transferase-like glycosyltransferase